MYRERSFPEEVVLMNGYLQQSWDEQSERREEKKTCRRIAEEIDTEEQGNQKHQNEHEYSYEICGNSGFVVNDVLTRGEGKKRKKKKKKPLNTEGKKILFQRADQCRSWFKMWERPKRKQKKDSDQVGAIAAEKP